jgi:hypothetical protein
MIAYRKRLGKILKEEMKELVMRNWSLSKDKEGKRKGFQQEG